MESDLEYRLIELTDVAKETTFRDRIHTDSENLFSENTENKLWTTASAFGIGCIPFIVTLVLVKFLSQLLLAMYSMHIIIIVLLCIHIKVSKSFCYYKTVWNTQKKFLLIQIPWALASILVGLIITYVTYLVFRCGGLVPICISDFYEKVSRLEIVDVSNNLVIVSGVYFIFVNPVFEEFFWRVFLYKELGANLFIVSGTNNFEATEFSFDQHEYRCWPKSLPIEKESYLITKHPSTGVEKLHREIQASEPGTLICCMMYASYHFVIFDAIAGTFYAIFGCFCLVLLGRLFHYLRKTHAFGIITAIGLHMGVDLGGALVLLHIMEKE